MRERNIDFDDELEFRYGLSKNDLGTYYGQIDQLGKRSGFGRQITKNCKHLFEGMFKNDELNGFVRAIQASGIIKEGVYENGCFKY